MFPVIQMAAKRLERRSSLLTRVFRYHIQPACLQKSYPHQIDEVWYMALATQACGLEHVVKAYIESYLTRSEDTVLSDCAEKPSFMLPFALDVKSGWIYKQAAARVAASTNEDLVSKILSRCSKGIACTIVTR